MNVHVTITLEELILLKADARGFSFLPRQPVTSLLAGRHASRLRGRGLAFEELRHYHQGDDIRTMDWKATARLRSPHVRVYTEERERPVLLVVDQRRTMFFGSRRAMKSVTAAEVAAVGAWRVLAAGDRVGGIVFNNDEILDVSPHRSQTRVLRLLHEVVRLNQTLARQAGEAPGHVSLNQALEAALRRAKHDHLVVLISDLDGADYDTQRLATLLAAHNDVLVVAIYDPLGASLQGLPGMVATSRGATYEIPSDTAFAASFRQAFAARLDQWTDIFHALRVPVIPISTATSPVHQLRDLFGAHLHRRPSSP
ncbi:MAG: DUF58 domain-containing protein [Anaerolineales bacterium]|nr:DUF58 domain-containing protein [Anaerolineales bacterium]